LKAGEVTLFPLNDPAWTLSLEIFINFIFALICRRLTTPRLGALVFVAGLGLIASLWSYGDPNLGWKWHTYPGGWARVTFSFFAGVLLYRLFRLNKGAALPPWIGGLLALALLADLACAHIGRTYTMISCIVLFPAIVWIGARTESRKPLRFLEAWLGKTSYAVYIVHMPLLTIYVDIFARLNIDTRAHAVPIIVLCAIVSLAIASALDAVYDMPVRTYLTRRLRFFSPRAAESNAGQAR
jgi:peptidoglycan/LPS O-acetylase OafA/YrhL